MMEDKQLTFDDVMQSFECKQYIINQIYLLRDKVNNLDDIKIFTNDKNLSEFYLWRASIFEHINNIIYDFKKKEYR